MREVVSSVERKFDWRMWYVTILSSFLGEGVVVVWFFKSCAIEGCC